MKFRKWHLRMQEGLDTGERSSFSQCGKACFLSDDFKKAAEVFRRAIATDPSQVDNYEGLGLALMDLGDILGARQVFQTACRLAPENKIAKSNLERAQKTKISPNEKNSLRKR